MRVQLCGWAGGELAASAVFEQLACPGPVLDAVLILFSLTFLPADSLYTCDEQVVASE